MRVLLVASLVFRAPSGPAVGPGCLMCPWAAARPLAVRAASFARRVGSKPGQASPRPRAPQPGPGLLYVAQRWLSIINFACNSPVACSNIEFASLELQRFQGLLKFGPIELHAKFIWS